MDGQIVIGVVAVALVSAAAGSQLGSYDDAGRVTRGSTRGLVLGLLFGPLGVLIAVVLSSGEQTRQLLKEVVAGSTPSGWTPVRATPEDPPSRTPGGAESAAPSASRSRTVVELQAEDIRPGDRWGRDPQKRAEVADVRRKGTRVALELVTGVEHYLEQSDRTNVERPSSRIP